MHSLLPLFCRSEFHYFEAGKFEKSENDSGHTISICGVREISGVLPFWSCPYLGSHYKVHKGVVPYKELGHYHSGRRIPTKTLSLIQLRICFRVRPIFPVVRFLCYACVYFCFEREFFIVYIFLFWGFRENYFLLYVLWFLKMLFFNPQMCNI